MSPKEQRRLNAEHAERHGGVLIEELDVPGLSRSIVLYHDAAERIPAYARLHELIEARAFDVFAYYDRSRLGRKAALSMAVIELCHQAGIATYETSNPPESVTAGTTTHDEQLIGAIKSVGAQREIERLMERHRIGMVERTKRGEFPAGVPWGWRARYDEAGQRTIEIDEAVVHYVRMLFEELYLRRRLGYHYVAEELNKAGSRAPAGGRWKYQNVQAVLSRVWRYAGYSEVNKRSASRPYTRARGNWPAIISEETARAVEAERATRRNARRAIGTKRLFSLCCWCEVCGYRMVYNTTIRQRPSRREQVSIRCDPRPHRRDPVPHDHRQISESKVMTAMRTTFEHIRDVANRETIAAAFGEMSGAVQKEEIKSVAALIERAQQGLHRADDAWIAGHMDDVRYQRQVEKLRQEILAAEEQRERLRSAIGAAEDTAKRRQRLDEAAASGLAMLESDDIPTANAWMRRHVRIWIRDCQVSQVEFI